MAAFINNDITTAGLIVLAKGVAGQKINYTKIVLGDGYLEEGQTPRTLTGVVSPKATVDITKLKINGDGTVAVGGIFTNGDETEGFYYRELGLYAEDPDPGLHLALINMKLPAFPVAFGVIRSVKAPVYDQEMELQIAGVKTALLSDE